MLTEADIFECLSANFKLAAEHCEDLARLPAKGPTYKMLRQELKLIEGACRQAGHYRGDARWLKIGLMMEEAHKRAGDWLRGVKQPNGTRRMLRPGEMHPLFVKLAENLRAGHAAADKIRMSRTGRRGQILPIMQNAPHRDTRPSGWRKTRSGLLLPSEMVA